MYLFIFTYILYKEGDKLNILVAAPNTNFDIDKIKTNFKENGNFDNDNIYYEDESLSKDILDSIDILVGYNKELLDKILNSDNAQLKWIQALSAGVDYYPLDQLKDKNVYLTTVSGIHAEPISETVIGMILGNYRAINESARKRSWYQPNVMPKMINGKHAVVFGTGHIGGRIAELLDAFGAETIGVNHSGHPADGFAQTVSMDNVMNDDRVLNADLIINALPLSDSTYHYYNEKFFNALNNQPMFISIGRGPSTVTDDLVDALYNQQLGSAALDVTDPEPLPADNPLWKMDNVLITAHISGLHAEYMDESLAILDENMQAFNNDGKPNKNLVNLVEGY
ncbi:hydroxyacid dehydrogenase [Apilactobacillus micheneri]|uniref:Hydroxyacid dehydrogenase n=1 Tax=Apilactobacillus micheneri TaxID=1899430 RepID=A0ABY2YWN8_9LACO|nr:hydroxyacid dehydrogenase [Apilactobacillus micheneri]TPR25850.1 hydroxyacid dehydrogenase [Apilactobacillus micheneri]TPR28040.1 hydroxyacid dehydrogenase [Apilactobacillus micheneri]TPR29531.1 hydroxyacid dehydrogenase [Apilactobacillus micheneri]TPR30317.1 hydroxyacid dehydrogenase [Apilactobacillus micheneri]